MFESYTRLFVLLRKAGIYLFSSRSAAHYKGSAQKSHWNKCVKCKEDNFVDNFVENLSFIHGSFMFR